MGPHGVCSDVTFHHASGTDTMLVANRKDSGKWHFQRRQDAASQNRHVTLRNMFFSMFYGIFFIHSFIFFTHLFLSSGLWGSAGAYPSTQKKIVTTPCCQSGIQYLVLSNLVIHPWPGYLVHLLLGWFMWERRRWANMQNSLSGSSIDSTHCDTTNESYGTWALTHLENWGKQKF